MIRKSLFGFFLLSFLYIAAQAQPKKTTTHSSNQGYRIEVNIKPYKNEYVYLGYYYADGKQYVVDSAKLNATGTAVFSGKKKLVGGLHIIAFPQKIGFVDLVIDKNQNFKMHIDTNNIIEKTSFTGSPENVTFYKYQTILYKLSMESASPNKNQSKINAYNAQLEKFRDSLVKKDPNCFLSLMFKTTAPINIPKTLDSNQAYHYYIQHYWNNVALNDERLLRNPLFLEKFNTFFDRLVIPNADTLSTAAFDILDQAKKDSAMYEYCLSQLVYKYINSPYMGQDKVFVRIFEKYLATKPSWIDSNTYRKIETRAYFLVGNLIGNKAINFSLLDTGNTPFTLYDLKNKYTVVYFFSPVKCENCNKAFENLDSIYNASWKKKGVNVLVVAINGTANDFKKAVKTTKHANKNWKYGYETDEMRKQLYQKKMPNYRQLYDVLGVPMLYLLGEDKTILAKKITHTQMDAFIK